ncbi:class I SAM-dependent methyltransferase [Streptomyces sp. MN03-5084-2B]|nr:class I SAM-dependent methyltransferase [Streptomyces sp. MN03-5084-2B]
MTTSTARTTAGRSAADIFNSAVAATAVGAAWDLGALDELNERRVLLVDHFATENDLDPDATAAMFRALASVDIVRRDGEKIVPGAAFDEVYLAKPLFYWLCQGSWELFANMPSLLRNENRIGDFHRRDARAVSHASRAANNEFFDPLFWKAMESVGEVGSVADLGSGSGERLIKIVERNKEARGIGVDISAATIEMSESEVAKRGLAGDISFVRADVRQLDERAEFADVELLTCFMMGHDLWPREDAITSLRMLRRVFPKARRFLLGDTVRSENVPDDRIPVFTLGFEAGHALMGTYIPTLSEWREVIDSSGWRCAAVHTNSELAGTVVFELE